MKRKITNIVLALALIAAGLMGNKFDANAGVQTTGWDVSYDGNGLTSNYDIEKSTITSVMPGDTVVFAVTYNNNSGGTADFYLSTDIINSLEEKNADGSTASVSGGAYSYKLSYTVGETTTILYDSETLGGDNTEVLGLKQAQGGENTFFDVGVLPAGGSGVVEIEIALDGNSQDNAYMQKLASLDVKFGVEKVKEQGETIVVTNTETRRVVYTVPGGTEVIVLDEPTVPLAVTATTPQTGDSVIPLIICSVMLVFGSSLIIWYFWLTKKARGKVS